MASQARTRRASSGACWALESRPLPTEMVGEIAKFIPTFRGAPLSPFGATTAPSARAVHGLLKARVLSREDVNKLDPCEGFVFEIEEWRRDPFDYFVGRNMRTICVRNPFASRKHSRWRHGDPEVIAGERLTPNFWPELTRMYRIGSEASSSDLSD